MKHSELAQLFQRVATLSLAALAPSACQNGVGSGAKAVPSTPGDRDPPSASENEPAVLPRPSATPSESGGPSRAGGSGTVSNASQEQESRELDLEHPERTTFDLSAFHPRACQRDDPAGLLAGIRANERFDYLELRGATRFRADSVEYGNVLGRVGTPCAQAKDKATCEAKLENIKPSAGFAGECAQICGFEYLVGTRGGEVFSVQDVDGIEKFLGTIDNESDLVLLVHARGYEVACGTEYGTIRKAEEGWHVVATRRTADCPVEMTRYLFHVRPSGETTVLGQEVLKSAGICIGRRLAGAAPRPGYAWSEIGGLFAMAAELEAESVESFCDLARMLRRFAAPEALAQGAEAAARDERRHARSMSRLAARFGAVPRAPRSGSREARSLFELARDNAVEGCVRETFGALVATRQAMAAREPHVAETMRSIARDETRHAALAFAIAEWVKPALTVLERRELERATRAAVVSLEAECAEEPSTALREVAGLPSADTALAMIRALELEVWRA